MWEIAIIAPDGREYCWQIKPDMSHADPRALDIGGYWDRCFAHLDEFVPLPGHCKATHHPDPERAGKIETAEEVARDVAGLLAGASVVGSNPAFDERFLTLWMRRHGQPWAAHYRTVDVTTLGAGALEPTPPLPWSSHAISLVHDVDPDDYARHTALGDARWVKALYEAITERKPS